jgi:hypothetical protein
MAVKAKSRILGLAVCGLCWLGILAQAQAFPDIPTPWNVTISGVTLGYGHITFVSDGTLTGYFIIRPTPQIKPENQPAVYHFGFFGIFGGWDIDPFNPKRVTGFFSGGDEDVPLDASFVATGTDLKITIKATSTNGPIRLKGIPALPLPTDLTGTWSAQVLKNGIKTTELFALTPRASVCVLTDNTDPDNPVCIVSTSAINLYDLIGNGPGYVAAGVVLLSAGNHIALELKELHIDKDTLEVAEDGTGRATTGNLNVKSVPGKAHMKGTDENAANVSVVIIKTSP